MRFWSVRLMDILCASKADESDVAFYTFKDVGIYKI